MSLETNLKHIRNLLNKVLQPTPNSPYITSEEIDINDKMIQKALDLTIQSITLAKLNKKRIKNNSFIRK